MRGVDYRTKEKATLFIASGFESDRAAQQAYMRVGRFEDKCVRVLVGMKQIVNNTEQFAYLKRLINALKQF